MIREGWVMPLKGLLFALAPRLDKLTFLPYVMLFLTGQLLGFC